MHAQPVSSEVIQKAVERGQELNPLRWSNKACAKYVESKRAVTALDYCLKGHSSGVHADSGREPFLLVESGANPGEYQAVAIMDTRIKPVEDSVRLCWLYLSSSEVLVEPDTLVFWK
jgi:hypothetical protein